MWQDIIFTAGGLIFVIALMPSVFSANKPAPLTSLITALVTASFAATYVTLGLWFSAATTLLTSFTWLTLFIQAKTSSKTDS